jgi:hypothetical protein
VKKMLISTQCIVVFPCSTLENIISQGTEILVLLSAMVVDDLHCGCICAGMVNCGDEYFSQGNVEGILTVLRIRRTILPVNSYKMFGSRGRVLNGRCCCLLGVRLYREVEAAEAAPQPRHPRQLWCV